MDLSVKAHELAIKLTSISEAVKSVGTSASSYTADSKEYWLLQEQNILPSRVLTSCFFFLEVNTFLLLEVCGVSFHCFGHLSSGSIRLFGGFNR